METLAGIARPRLGEPFASFTQRFGLPLRTLAAGGHVRRHYRSDVGGLTACFSQGRCVGLRVVCQPAVSSRQTVCALAETLQADDSSATRLVSADSGWVLLMGECADHRCASSPCRDEAGECDPGRGR